MACGTTGIESFLKEIETTVHLCILSDKMSQMYLKGCTYQYRPSETSNPMQTRSHWSLQFPSALQGILMCFSSLFGFMALILLLLLSYLP